MDCSRRGRLPCIWEERASSFATSSSSIRIQTASGTSASSTTTTAASREQRKEGNALKLDDINLPFFFFRFHRDENVPPLLSAPPPPPQKKRERERETFSSTTKGYSVFPCVARSAIVQWNSIIQTAVAVAKIALITFSSISATVKAAHILVLNFMGLVFCFLEVHCT